MSFTVKELIDKLQEMEQNADVIIFSNDRYSELSNVNYNIIQYGGKIIDDKSRVVLI